MKRISLCLALATSLLLSCAGPMAISSKPKGDILEKGETPSKFLPSLPADEQEEFELAQRGLRASEPVVDIRTRERKPDMKEYEFLVWENAAPDTVNPALWRHPQPNTIHGLFRSPNAFSRSGDMTSRSGKPLSPVGFLRGTLKLKAVCGNSLS